MSFGSSDAWAGMLELSAVWLSVHLSFRLHGFRFWPAAVIARGTLCSTLFDSSVCSRPFRCPKLGLFYHPQP